MITQQQVDQVMVGLRTFEEAAAQLGVSRQTIANRVERGLLPRISVGTLAMIPAAAVDQCPRPRRGKSTTEAALATAGAA